jgi:soluble lytic murein transglycosylase
MRSLSRIPSASEHWDCPPEPVQMYRLTATLAVFSASFMAATLASAVDLGDFLAAERALEAGDRLAFESLIGRLADHPLRPYLQFARFRAEPEGGRDGEIESFLTDYADTPLADRLRPAYLERLAAGARWADYARVFAPLAAHDDEPIERRCLYLRALIETGRSQEALEPARIEPIWLHGRSRPDACDPVFAAWEAAGGITTELRWARIRLAMEAGQPGLARWLGQGLPDTEQRRVHLWLSIRDQPERTLELIGNTLDHPTDPAILADGLGRLARARPQEAADALDRLVSRGAFTPKRDPAAWAQAHVGVARGLQRARPKSQRTRALTVWARLEAREANLATQEERLRTAVALGAWRQVILWIEAMPPGDIRDDRWLYWLARAREALGEHEAAHAGYVRAAGQRSLWGFLAADRVGRPYQLESRPVPADPARIRALMARPAMARIQALRALGRETDLRREWRHLTGELDDADRKAAAYIADVWDWHDQAIFTLAPTGYWDDLNLRFPVAHLDLVQEQAWQTGLPEDWILAVIRQESVFNPTVASHAGALGLMQLMPGTARQMAEEMEPPEDAPTRRAILDPARNIGLGAAYLARMRDRFGHPALATAAYNAGPHRVDRWLPDACQEADLWILAIPFEETRGYVERVLAYRVIYRARLGLEPRWVSELLPPVPGRSFFE